MKKIFVLSVAITLILAVGVGIAVFAFQNRAGEPPQSIRLDETEIAFAEGSAFDESHRYLIAKQLTSDSAPPTTRALLCQWFGHRDTTELVTLVLHRADAASPRCEVQTWQIAVCVRCDRMEKTAIDHYYKDCCPIEDSLSDYEQDLYGEKLTTVHEAALFLTVRGHGWLNLPDVRPKAVRDGHTIDRWVAQDDTTHAGTCTGACCAGGDPVHIEAHRWCYTYTVEEREGEWWIVQTAGCADCKHQIVSEPYTSETHSHVMQLRFRQLEDANGERYHVREEWCDGCLYLVRTPFACLSPDGKQCAAYGCRDQLKPIDVP